MIYRVMWHFTELNSSQHKNAEIIVDCYAEVNVAGGMAY